jgi:hypothetical protein
MRRKLGWVVVQLSDDEVTQVELGVLDPRVERGQLRIERPGGRDKLSDALLQSVGQLLQPPGQEVVEAIGRQRALGLGRQPVALQHEVYLVAQRGTDRLEICRWSLLADRDVRGAVDQHVVEDRVDLAPRPMSLR